MRAYALSHFLLMPLQKGLQSNHAICRIRSDNLSLVNMYDDWEKNHTTIILLNGGFSRQLEDTVQKFYDVGLDTDLNDFKYPVPWADFREDKDTMEGMRTAVACILHARYYGAMAALRSNKDLWKEPEDLIAMYCQATLIYEKHQQPDSDFMRYTLPEREFIDYLSQFSLAS